MSEPIEEEFEPPKLAPGSPQVPGGVPPPLPGDRVFVDTNVMFHESYRLPLAICAVQQFLYVSWSPYVAAEVARVATRNYAEKQLALDPSRADVIQAIASVRDEIDHVNERQWHSPDPEALTQVRPRADRAPLKDVKDRPVLAGALATGSTFLLSLDSGFAHGEQFEDVVFWHPDTFLYAFFITNADHYAVVREEMPSQLRAALRPKAATP